MTKEGFIIIFLICIVIFLIVRIHFLIERIRKDSLTGLLSEYGFIEKRSKRSKDGTLVLLDLDGFKQINDTLGHDAGDFAIKKFGEFLRQSLRKNDFAARLHGDEFIVFLDGADEAAAKFVMEHLLQKLQENAFLYQKRFPIRLKASYGVCGIGGSLDEMIKTADKRMYENKRSKKR